MSSYTWSTPTLTDDQKYLLCHGYITKNSNKYVIKPIIELCAEYLINDDIVLSDLKNAKNKDLFIGQVIDVASFKFYWKLYPNGDVSSTTGKVVLLFVSAFIPSNISKILINLKIICPEIDENIIITRNLTYPYTRWSSNFIDLATFDQLKKLNKFSMKFTIDIINIWDASNDAVVQLDASNNLSIKPILLPETKYIWNINDKVLVNKIKKAKNGESFQSVPFDIGGLKWYLKLFPNGYAERVINTVCLHFYLLNLPPKINKVYVRYTLFVADTDNKISNVLCMDSQLKSGGIFSIKTNEIQDFNQYSMHFYLTILDVFDKDNNRINDYGMNSTNKSLIAKEIDISGYSGYQWKLCNKNMVINGDDKVSAIFKMFGSLKWYLRFQLINNKDGDHDDEKKANKDDEDIYGVLWFSLTSMPSNIAYISIYAIMSIKETNKEEPFCLTLTSKPNYYRCRWRNALSHQSLLNLNELTFGIEVHLIDIYDKNGDNLMNQFKDDLVNDIDDNKTDDIVTVSKLREISLPITTYTWHITNTKLIQDIKTANNVFAFKSPLFKAFSGTYYIGLWPNGSRESRKGSINIFLNFVTANDLISSDIDVSFVLKFTFFFTEINKESVCFSEYSKEESCCGKIWSEKIDDMNQLNSFTFKVVIELIDAYYDNKCVTSKYCNDYKPQIAKGIQCPSMKYEWIVPDDILLNMKQAQFGDMWQSDIFVLFGINWFLRYYPNGKNETEKGNSNLLLYIKPLDNSKTSIVSIRYTVIVGDIQLVNTTSFYNDKLFVSWGPERLSFDKFIKLHPFKISIEIELISYYVNNQDMKTKLGVNKTNNLINI